MRKAIWSAGSGEMRLDLHGPLLPNETRTAKFNYGCRIDLVPERHDEGIFKIVKERLDERGNPFKSTNIILDRQMIRSTSPEVLAGLQAWDLALPETAISFEPSL